MDHYNVIKKLTDQKLHAIEAHILSIRQRSQKLSARHSNLLDRQRDLMEKNGGFDAKDSDKIHLNVGGTEMYILRETLTQVKGSRLEAVFSGRWENKLLRDKKGRVFMDLDARYFKIIVEHLHLMNTNFDDNQENIPDWPSLQNENEQRTLDLYIDFFRLKSAGNNAYQSLVVVKSTSKDDNSDSEYYGDLLDKV